MKPFTCYNCKRKAAVVLFEQPHGFRARVCTNCNYFATYSYSGNQKTEAKTLKRFWIWYHSVEFCLSLDLRAFMGDPARPIDRAIALLEALSSFKALPTEYPAKGKALRALGAPYGLVEAEVRKLYDAWLDLQVEREFAGEGEA